jgi:hypothetical protein
LTASQVKANLTSTGLFLSTCTALVSMTTIYLLLVSGRLMKKVTDKNDPFSITSMLAMTLAFIDLQRIVFKIAIFIMVSRIDEQNPSQIVSNTVLEVTRMRYAIMSVEMLFICIPLKHNFQPHRLEM